MSPAKPARRGPNWKKESDQKSLPVVPIVIGVVVVLAIIAIFAAAMADDSKTSTEGLQQVGPVAVDGDPLPPMPDGGADPAVGVVAPEVEGQSFDGSSVEIGDDGRPKVLVFLAHWCPHCQVEVPKLVDWLGDNGVPEDVDVYGIATGTSQDRPNYPPSRWLDREGWDQPTLVDSNEGNVASAFGLSAFPFFVALDSDNAVVARGSGELSIPEWEALLDAARG